MFGSKINVRLLAFIAVMSALGNVVGMFSITIPSPILRIELHFSQLIPLLVGMSLGPLAGAITGALSVIVSTIKIGNPLIPFGNAILAGVAGLAGKKFRPFFSGILGAIAETPFLWFSIILWAGIVSAIPMDVLVPMILTINAKAFIEVAISSIIIEILLSKKSVRHALNTFKDR